MVRKTVVSQEATDDPSRAPSKPPSRRREVAVSASFGRSPSKTDPLYGEEFRIRVASDQNLSRPCVVRSCTHSPIASPQGNSATDQCCSKCWRELQKKQGHDIAPPPPKKEEVCQPVEPEPEPMEVDAPPSPAPVLKKKKKKTSYKAMMAAMTTAKDRDVEKEKESLRKVTGGGAFSKIDKI